jgi:hypothetical protein
LRWGCSGLSNLESSFLLGVGDLVGAPAEYSRFDLRWCLGDGLCDRGSLGVGIPVGIMQLGNSQPHRFFLLLFSLHWKLWYNGSYWRDRLQSELVVCNMIFFLIGNCISHMHWFQSMK